MLSDVVFERDLLEVVEQFLALGEIARPRVSRAEREGIGMVRRIDAAAGVAVDIPGAAEFGVLLDDGVGDAEPAERNAQRDGADAGADDQHMLLRELLTGRRLGPARFAGNETHFLAHQRRIFRRDVFAERRAHHLQHQLVAGVGDDGLRFAVFEQLQHGGADFGLDFRRQAGLRIGNQADVAPGLVGRFQPALVAGHVDQHHQQHADVALGDRGRQIEFLARQFDIHARVLTDAPGASAQAAIGGPGGACDISGVDRKVDSGDAAAHRRQQPRDRLRDLDRLDQPVHRGRAFEQLPVQRAGGDAGFQRGGAREAGRDRVDAHAGAAPFGGKRLRDLDDAGFRGGVGVDRPRRHAGDGGDIDDGAMPALGHLHADAARDQEGAAQVDVDLAVPLIHPHALDRVHLAEDAGGVDEAGDRAVRGLDIGDAADDGAFARDIERRRPQDRLRSRQRLRRDIDDHDRWPCSASSVAVAAPMPRLPPVTRTIPSAVMVIAFFRGEQAARDELLAYVSIPHP